MDSNERSRHIDDDMRGGGGTSRSSFRLYCMLIDALLLHCLLAGTLAGRAGDYYLFARFRRTKGGKPVTPKTVRGGGEDDIFEREKKNKKKTGQEFRTSRPVSTVQCNGYKDV